VECGPDLAACFLNSHLVDEIWHYEAQLDLDGKAYDLTQLSKNFDLVEKIQIDEENIFFKYLLKERSESAFFNTQTTCF